MESVQTRRTVYFLAGIMLTLGLIFSGKIFSQEVFADEKDNTKLVIVSTNDVHCNLDAKAEDDADKAYIGYAAVAEIYNEKKAEYSNVALVDAGDHIQGAPIGLLTKGQAIINIMNKIGYTTSTLGNHEFDYGLDRLFYLTKEDSTNPEKADYPYICCNFVSKITNDTVYKPYVMENYTFGSENIKVAYVGITTPETLSMVASATFTDENGNIIYDLCQDETGAKLYAQIQKYVDTARTEGADYVILVGHVGQTGRPNKWRSDTIVQNITGVNAFIDGHSHEKYIQTVKDKEGKDVVVTQTGTMLNAVGVMTIDFATGKVEADVVQAPVASNSEINAYISQLEVEFEEDLKEKIAYTPYKLEVFKEDNYNWLVRDSETNMADLLTDAFKNMVGTDVAILGGGSIRNRFNVGDITYNDALAVQPWGNDTAIIMATGQQIKDALEMGAMKYPEPSGGFMQVSGITYEIATDIDSSVKVDNNGLFVGVEGEYRVRNIKINGKPIDLKAEYSVGGITYTLINGGDGLSMFKDAKVVVAAGNKDFDVFAQYLKKIGTIGEEYANITGSGRIKFIKARDEKSPETGDDNSFILYFVLLFGCSIIMYKQIRKRIIVR